MGKFLKKGNTFKNFNHTEFRLEVRDDLFLPKMIKHHQMNRATCLPLEGDVDRQRVEFSTNVDDSTPLIPLQRGTALRIHFWMYLIIGGLFFTSCGPNYIFDEEKIIADSNWTYADSLVFQFNISDTTKVYNLNLEVEHETAYRHQNLYVQIATLFPSKKRNEQVLSLELANKYGAWLGDCNSENCSLLVPLQQQIYFQEVGAYDFVLKQFMRESSVSGVQKFALKIEETELTK